MFWDWLAHLKDLVLICSAAYGAYLAHRGLRAWQQELRGKSAYQISVDMVRSAVKLRSSIEVVRQLHHTFHSYPSELLDDEGKVINGLHYDVYVKAYMPKLTEMNEAYADLDEKTLEVMVHLGLDYSDILSEAHAIREEFNLKLFQQVRRWMRPDGSLGDITECKVICKPISDVPDEFTIKVNRAIEGIEAELRKHTYGKQRKIHTNTFRT